MYPIAHRRHPNPLVRSGVINSLRSAEADEAMEACIVQLEHVQPLFSARRRIESRPAHIIVG